jgi:hypothetical protein
MNINLVLILSVILIGISGCQNKGAMEKAGERADEMIDNAKDGDNILKNKGPMEKAGESIDDSVDKLKGK